MYKWFKHKDGVTITPVIMKPRSIIEYNITVKSEKILKKIETMLYFPDPNSVGYYEKISEENLFIDSDPREVSVLRPDTIGIGMNFWIQILILFVVGTILSVGYSLTLPPLYGDWLIWENVVGVFIGVTVPLYWLGSSMLVCIPRFVIKRLRELENWEKVYLSRQTR
jgi:hypothetical protein